MWDYLVARYRCIEHTQMMQHLAHDQDFKLFIADAIKCILEDQADDMEKELEKIGLALPKRPPKSVSDASVRPEIFTDEYIFHQIYIGCGNYFDQLIYAIRGLKTNDTLRKKFMDYLMIELEVYDDLTKYGKVKGWLEAPPMYYPH